jgi:hypothetical protein
MQSLLADATLLIGEIICITFEQNEMLSFKGFRYHMFVAKDNQILC